MSVPDPEAALPRLVLRRGEEHRIRAGHPWVFSNEVDVARSPLTAFERGAPADVASASGRLVGSAYVNGNSLICARIVSRRSGVSLDRRLLVERLREAERLRARVFPGPFYRLAYGESDRLPGLVADRFGPVVVAQIGTAGIERLRDDVVEAIARATGAACVVLRNDGPGRELEGLDRYVDVARGTLPETVFAEENGARFRVDPIDGQKTGWYYDHRDNRARLARYARGASVLDLFAYAGGWGVQAALAGASRVLCVDASESALEQARENARINDVEGVVATERADAFDALKGLRDAGERFDVVVLDPPAFIRRRRDAKKGIEAYARLNRLAMQVLAGDALLICASCSSHLERARLVAEIHRAARRSGRRARVLEHGGHAPDHPVHPAMPESEYLKAVFTRVY